MNIAENLKYGKFNGICTDLSAFINTQDFLDNLKYLQHSDINIISAGFQSPNPNREYYKKSRNQDRERISLCSDSAITSNGEIDLDSPFLANLELITTAAESLGLAVLVNILDASCEHIFVDAFAVVTGIFNAIDWLISKQFNNIIVNLTNISQTFYKSSILNGEKFINMLESVKKSTGDKLIIGAGMKNFAGVSESALDLYIKSSDFIPLYSLNYKTHNTKKMLENIYYFKSRTDIPLIMAKGDDLSDKYNSYGKNNMLEARENGVSWFYYNLEKLGIEPVDWGFLRNVSKQIAQ